MNKTKFTAPSPQAVAAFLHRLRLATRGLPEPMSVVLGAEYHHDPFIILISCLLSLRSRDTVTYGVSKKLFAYARTPQELIRMPLSVIETIIHPIGFYHRKAATILRVSQQLIDEYQGRVPATEKELLSLYGVGRKTANLVLAEAFGQQAICVDVHVHRLANRFGLVHAKTPEETEEALKQIIPHDQWRDVNRLLVMCGQHRCHVQGITSKA